MLARRIRENRIIRGFYSWTFGRAVPLGFALGLIVAGVVLSNRVIFDAASAAGLFCRDEPTPDADAKFTTDAMCWNTGFHLDKGHQYRITLTTDGNWFNATHKANAEGLSNVEGLSASSWLLDAAWPLKRWWREDWFKPIARVGRRGNDEYVLNHVQQRDSDDLRQEVVTDIEARTSGCLFIYVNDAVLMWSKIFYSDNRGTANVSVSELKKLNGSAQKLQTSVHCDSLD
jgi:hypothetical protein